MCLFETAESKRVGSDQNVPTGLFRSTAVFSQDVISYAAMAVMALTCFTTEMHPFIFNLLSIIGQLPESPRLKWFMPPFTKSASVRILRYKQPDRISSESVQPSDGKIYNWPLLYLHTLRWKV